jgi:hypothetical protein
VLGFPAGASIFFRACVRGVAFILEIKQGVNAVLGGRGAFLGGDIAVSPFFETPDFFSAAQPFLAMRWFFL